MAVRWLVCTFSDSASSSVARAVSVLLESVWRPWTLSLKPASCLSLSFSCSRRFSIYKESDGRRNYQSEASTLGSRQSQRDPWQHRKVNGDHVPSRPGLILHASCWAGSLFLRLTSRRRTSGGIAAGIVFSGFLFDQYGVSKKHTHTQRHRHGHKTLPAVANKALADAAGVGHRAMKLKTSTN